MRSGIILLEETFYKIYILNMSDYTRIIYNLRVAGKYIGYAETEEAVMELFDDYVEANQIKDAFADVSIEYDNVYEDYEEKHWENLATHNERFTDD